MTERTSILLQVWPTGWPASSCPPWVPSRAKVGYLSQVLTDREQMGHPPQEGAALLSVPICCSDKKPEENACYRLMGPHIYLFGLHCTLKKNCKCLPTCKIWVVSHFKWLGSQKSVVPTLQQEPCGSQKTPCRMGVSSPLAQILPGSSTHLQPLGSGRQSGWLPCSREMTVSSSSEQAWSPEISSSNLQFSREILEHCAAQWCYSYASMILLGP